MPRIRAILSAVALLLAAAAGGALLVRGSRESLRRADLRESLREASAAAHRWGPKEIAPEPGTVNGADLYLEAAGLASVSGPESTACNEATFFTLFGMNWTRPASPEALAAAARNAPALEALARAAAEPSCGFPWRLPTADSPEPIPETKFSLLAQLLEVRGRGEVQDGNLGAALETVRLLGRFGGSVLADEPCRLACGVNIHHHQASLAERLAVHPALDAPTARALLESLPASDTLDAAFRFACDFREYQIKDLAFRVLEPGGRAVLLGQGPWLPYPWTSHDSWRAMHGPGQVRTLFAREGRADPDPAEVEELLSTWAEYRAAWDLVGAESSKVESRILARLLGGGHTLAADALWASTYPRTFVLNLQGRLACLRTLLLLRIGELEGGSVPASLPEPPLDPWDGRPVRWRIDPGEWVIWVVGSDGKDDGGLGAPVQVDLLLRRHIAAPSGR